MKLLFSRYAQVTSVHYLTMKYKYKYAQLAPVHYLTIPDICLFWYTTTIVRPVKITPKSARMHEN